MLTRPDTERIPMPKEEFYRRAETGDEHLVDWEEGEAIRMSPAHGRHGFFIAQLFSMLRSHLGAEGKVRAEVFIDFGSRSYGADLVVLLAANAVRYRDGRVYGPPDVVVEVLSPDSEVRDRVTKFDFYWEQGVLWYWIGDPERGLLEEYHRTEEGYVRSAAGDLEHAFRPRALPGLAIDVGELLED